MAVMAGLNQVEVRNKCRPQRQKMLWRGSPRSRCGIFCAGDEIEVSANEEGDVKLDLQNSVEDIFIEHMATPRIQVKVQYCKRSSALVGERSVHSQLGSTTADFGKFNVCGRIVATDIRRIEDSCTSSPLCQVVVRDSNPS